MDELSADRASYLSALAKQKDNLNKNDNILVNPSVSSASSFGNDNDFSYYQNAKNKVSNVVTNVEVDNRNWWQRTWDTIADFRNNITKGFLNFIDGIGDIFGTITGTIAEAAGNHQLAEDIKNKWINVDWVTPTTQALSKLNIIEAYNTGDLFTKDYWTKLDSNYNTAKENSYFKDNELVQTISSGIGSVLPSIGLHIATGGLSTAVQTGVVLGSLGASAAGNQAQEALEDNATFGQALGSGAISGGIEIGTELASAGIGKLGGKILQKMGFTKAAKVVTEASKSVNGYRLGKEALEETAKMGFKGFTVGAISEGLEEVASEFFSPLAKMVYKDNAWDEKWGTPEAKKQTMKEFGLAFIGGAIGSLVGGTVSKGMSKSQLAQQQAMEEKFGGQKGLELALTVDEIGQLTKEQALEFNKGNNGQQANIELIEENTNKINQLTEEYQKGIAEFEKNDPVNYQKFATAMMDAVKTPKMSMKLKGSDLLTPEEANKPKYFNSKGDTYVNINDTNNFLKQTLDNINNKLGNNQYVELPVNKNIMEQRAFTEVNDRITPSYQANKLMTLLENSNVRERTSQNGAYKVVGTIKDILTTKQLGQIKKALTQILEHSKTTTPNKAMAKVIDRISVMLKENTNRIKSVHNIGKLKVGVNEVIKNNFEITNDTIAKVGLDFLFKPFVDLKFDSNGKGYKTNGLRENLIKVLDIYTEKNFNIESDTSLKDSKGEKLFNLEFNPAIRNNLEKLLESLPTNNTTLNAEQLKLVEDTMRMIKKESIKARTKEKAFIEPFAKNTMKKIVAPKDNIFRKIKKLINRVFLPAYEFNRSVTGFNTTLSELTSTKMIEAQSNKILYIGDFQSKLYSKIKELNISKDLAKLYEIKIGNDTFEVNGSELVNLYNNLHTKDNFDAINESGLRRSKNNTLDSKGIDYNAVVGHANELMNKVDKLMSDNMKEIAKYLKGELNGKIKEDYKEWFKKRYGEYNYLNTVEDYWTLRRATNGISNVEKMIRAPKAFDNGKSRVKNFNPVLIVDAFDSIGSYVNDLATEQYVKPLYRDYYKIINYKVNGINTIAKEITDTYGANELKTLDNSMREMVGLKDFKDGWFTKLTGKYAVAKLSLNLSTMLKQFASIYTSNIPLSKSFKAFFNNLFQNEKYKAEYKKLVDEIGGLKYRSGIEYAKGKVSAVQAGETVGVNISNKVLNKITKIGMAPISAMDLFTIKTGVYSLMIMGENEGFKIGTQENINFVKENWSEFEASQISNNPMSKNALARGDVGQLWKSLIGFMQGANRACFGSIYNKITTWYRNHNLNYETIKSNFETAKTNFDDIKTKYEQTQKELHKIEKQNLKDPKIEKEYKRLEKLLEEQTNRLGEAREKYEDARLARLDYNKYIQMGGKKIPLNVGASLVAQGLFITLVAELFKRITGKKDWREWSVNDIIDNLPYFALNTLVSWMPFVNVITGWIQYKEIGMGGAGLLQDLMGVYKSLSTYIENPTDYNRGQLIKSLFTGAGDLTGIPIDTLWNYVYGIIKPFNAEVAMDMKNVLYPISYKSMRNTVTTYIEDNKLDKAKSVLIQMEERFNGIKLSDSVAEEMINLTKSGYSVIPNVPNTTYTDSSGNEVNMDKDQIESMSQFFTKSNDRIDTLLASKEYRSLSEENKAKTLNNYYSMYGKVGKAKALKSIDSLSHVGKIMYATTNISKLPQMFAILTHLKTIEATKDKTQKELVLEYINKLSNYSSAEKSLLMYMVGYTLSGDALTKVKSYLNSKNVNSKIIKEIFGE